MERKILAVGLVLAAFAGAQPQPKPATGESADRRGRINEDQQYQRGQRALEKRAWDAAVEAFDQVMAANGTRAGGAMYWKAYAQNKQGRQAEALAVLDQLLKLQPASRWLDDAKALEVEVRQAQGQPLKPESAQDEDLKLVALSGIVHSDPERAMPILEKLLQGSQSPKVKEQALFVLMQSGTPKAREIVLKIAGGGANPDTQSKAVQILGMMGARKELGQIYASSPDVQVRRAAIQGFMSSGARDELLQAARTEKNPDLRREAIHMLGATRGSEDLLWQLYQAEADPAIRRELVHSMFSSRNADRMIEIARTDKDAGIRREAIHMLGNMGAVKAGTALLSLYGSETDKNIRREIVQALSNQGGKPLVEIARKETDPDLKRDIVRRLARMKGDKDATDYLLEILK